MIPISWIPPERLPAALLVLMPGRYLNFGAMTFVALLIGLLASRRELWSRLVLLFLTCGLLAGDHSMLWEFLEHHHHVIYQSNIRPLHVVWITTAALLAGSAWTRLHLTHPTRPTHLAPIAPIAPIAPVAPGRARIDRIDDHASTRRAIGRAFQRPHE